ncbi:TOG array regulator of axonemal microtubules protein 1 isoform X2 [Ambystoma mexicanum]|uniref:TOG array regulator of axonemal microtubules protein 1 isoform X2 n=1 Tax=Ambystoma mexicanum TaxID=8296 RepID=UPI0037E7F4FC
MAAAGSAVVVTPGPAPFQRGYEQGADRGQMLMCESRRSAKSPSQPGPHSLPGGQPLPRERSLPSPRLSRQSHGFRSSSPPGRSMFQEDDSILRRLGSPRECGRTLRALLSRTEGSGRLEFSQRADLFSLLPRVLADSGPELRPLCVQLLARLFGGEESDLEPLRLAVFPELLWHLPGGDVSQQRDLVHALHRCLRHSSRPQDMLSALVQHGLESPEAAVRSAVARYLPSLLTAEVACLDLRELTCCMVEKLSSMAAGEPPGLVRDALQHIKIQVGPDTFQSYIQSLPPNVRRRCNGLAELEMSSREPQSPQSADHIIPQDHNRDPTWKRLGHITSPLNGDSTPSKIQSHLQEREQGGLISKTSRDRQGTATAKAQFSDLFHSTDQNGLHQAETELCSSNHPPPDTSSFPFKEQSNLQKAGHERTARPHAKGRCGSLTSPPNSFQDQDSLLERSSRHHALQREGAQHRNSLPSKDLSTLKFGLIPPDLHSILLDQEDYKGRTHAMEELKALVQDYSPDIAPSPNVLGLISFLCNLLDDNNFKVVHGALEVLNLLVDNLNQSAEQYLRPVISATVKVLGDNKTVIRQEYMKTYMRLMKVVGPQMVLCFLLEHIKHKQSRVREEVVNVTIAALLTYPSEDFNLSQLARDIAPSLVDGKRKVRHAALEAFAVLASSMGSSKTSLLRAVDDVELNEDGDGVMNAVQARLARKTLPKLDAQGLVDYAIPLPSSAHGRGTHILPGADTAWLLSGYRTQSAQTHNGESVLRRYGSHNDLHMTDSSFSGRRVLSAGKGKNKLPWDNDPPPATGVQGKVSSYAKEQYSILSDFPSPILKPTQGTQHSDDESAFLKKTSKTLHTVKNSLDFNYDGLASASGLVDYQPFISGKRGQLAFSHTRGKSGSVDSELQFLGTNHHRQDKATLFASLNPSKKAHQPYSATGERTLPFPSSNSNPGSFILPSYPLSSPRASPKQSSPSSGSPKKSQEPFVAFSNSWPLKNFEGRPKPMKLSNQKPGEMPGEHAQETQLPLKPTLVRTSSRGNLNGNKPFPPITRGASPLPDKCDFNPAIMKKEHFEKDQKLAIDLSELSAKAEFDQEEMLRSLRSLHNSAAKKRAKLSGSTSDLESPDSMKLDLTPDSYSRTSSPTLSPYSESGIFSLDSLSSPLSPAAPRRQISDVFPPNGSKPCPARVPSARKKGSRIREHSPNSVTMTKELSSSDVSVIGQRMIYGSAGVDFEETIQKEVMPCPMRGHTKEQQKYPKHTKGPSLQQNNSLDSTSTHNIADDSVVIVGKGVFGSPSSPSLPYSHAAISSLENGNMAVVKQNTEPLSGVYGKAVQQNNPSNFSGLENDKDSKVTISRSAPDKMKQKKEHGSKFVTDSKDYDKAKDQNKEHSKNVHTERIATEGEISPSTRLPSNERMPSSPFTPEIIPAAEMRPFPKPEFALSEALRLLGEDDWEKKIEGLNYIRCLAAFHSDVLATRLHDTNLAVLQEVKNLRSGVSRAAVACLGDLFTHLKKNMDQELDSSVKGLLHKASESSAFIREDVDKALNAMVLHVTPARALNSLLNGGLSHLHQAVRKCTAHHLSDVVARMGPGRILSGVKDVTDRIIPAVAKLSQDGSPETRYHARKILCLLMSHPDFDKMIEKYVLPKDLPYIKEAVSTLRQKGLGEMPLDTPSAKGRRSLYGSFRGTRCSSTAADGLNATERETRETTSKPAPRKAMECAEYIKELTASLNAQDFRVRMEGIKSLLSDCEHNQELVIANIVKIFDAFKSRLHDSNSKVNLLALETMLRIIPLLKDSLSVVINTLIPAIVDNNLNSKNHGIYSAAVNVIQALVNHLDSYLLLPIFCSKAQHLSGKAKQNITERLADIVIDLYPRKPHTVEQKVLVVLWHLLGNLTNSGSLPGAGGNMRTATAKLSKALFAEMGENLLNQSASQPAHIRKTLEEFLEQST